MIAHEKYHKTLQMHDHFERWDCSRLMRFNDSWSFLSETLLTMDCHATSPPVSGRPSCPVDQRTACSARRLRTSSLCNQWQRLVRWLHSVYTQGGPERLGLAWLAIVRFQKRDALILYQILQKIRV